MPSVNDAGTGRSKVPRETENDRPVLPSLGWLVRGEGQEEAVPGKRRTEPSVSADKSAARQEPREG